MARDGILPETSGASHIPQPLDCPPSAPTLSHEHAPAMLRGPEAIAPKLYSGKDRQPCRVTREVGTAEVMQINIGLSHSLGKPNEIIRVQPTGRDQMQHLHRREPSGSHSQVNGGVGQVYIPRACHGSAAPVQGFAQRCLFTHT